MTKRKKYTSELKREAVRLMESSEKPSSDVARQLGARRNQLYKWKEQWVKHGTEAFPGKGKRSSQGEVVTRLKRELERVKEERVQLFFKETESKDEVSRYWTHVR